MIKACAMIVHTQADQVTLGERDILNQVSVSHLDMFVSFKNALVLVLNLILKTLT